MKTFEKMAGHAAEYFLDGMADEGFDTFRAMCVSYDWGAKEIKEEIEACVEEVGGYISGSTVFLSNDDEMPYKQFKKMVMEKIELCAATRSA